MRFISMFLLVAALNSGAAFAAGAPASEVLADLAREREVVRIDAPRLAHPDGKLAPVWWRDRATNIAAHAWIGARAIVELDGNFDAALEVRRVRVLMPTKNLWLVESTRADEDGLALAARLQRHAQFGRALRQALPDLYFARQRETAPTLAAPPNDPKYPGQWFLALINVEAAWRLESGTPTTTIVVVDNGCDLTHPDLVNKLDQGKDVFAGDDDPSYSPNTNGNEHGTACAGLVGAETNNNLGVAGTCPGCRLRCVRLLSDEQGGVVPISADMDAYQFVLDVNADVVSNSWGFTEATPAPGPLADAIDLVHTTGRSGLGAIVVFAAGNDDRALGDDELENLPGVVAVGAVDNFGEVAQFSNFGDAIDVVAPLGTLTTDIQGADGADPTDYTSLFGGTSSACPLVAGAFGLLISAAPGKTATELEMAMTATAKQSTFAAPDATGHDPYYGYGMIQPATAIALLAPTTQPIIVIKKHGCAIANDGAASTLALLAIALWFARRRACRRA